MHLVAAAGQFQEQCAEREQMAECRRSVGQDRCHWFSHLLGGGFEHRRDLTSLRTNGSVSATLATICVLGASTTSPRHVPLRAIKTVVTATLFHLGSLDQEKQGFAATENLLPTLDAEDGGTRITRRYGLVYRAALRRAIRTQRSGRLNFSSCDRLAPARQAPSISDHVNDYLNQHPTEGCFAFYYNGFHCSCVTARGWRVWLAPNAYGCQCCRHGTADTATLYDMSPRNSVVTREAVTQEIIDLIRTERGSRGSHRRFVPAESGAGFADGYVACLQDRRPLRHRPGRRGRGRSADRLAISRL